MDSVEAFRRSFVRTYTGKNVYPLELTEIDIDIRDIAHALANQCRFSGHTKFFYSVAQHSILVSNYLLKTTGDHEMALSGLLHDAAEAYLVDMPTPIKRLMPIYKEAEDRAMIVIERFFKLEYSMDGPTVKFADMALLATEARDLMGNPQDWKSLEGLTPLSAAIERWSIEDTEVTFLETFNRLNDIRNYYPVIYPKEKI